MASQLTRLKTSNIGAGRPVVLICGDLHNLGDLALVLQNLEIASDEGRPAFVRRWDALPAEISRQVVGAGGTVFDGRSIAAVLRVVRGADLVIGGGQLIRDNTSVKALAALLASTLAVRAQGGRVLTRGLGVSRIRNPLRRLLWRAILASCARINVRDAASVGNLDDLLGAGRARLTADMAFLPGALQDVVHGGSGEGDNPRHILISPCIDSSENRSIEGRAIPTLIETLQLELPGLPFVIGCHDPRPGMDVHAAERLQREHGRLAGSSLIDGYQLETLSAGYRDAAIVVTNRLHAVIFSLLSDRPVLVINDGSHKTAAMAAAFNLPVLAAGVVTTPAVTALLVRQALNFDRVERRARVSEYSKRAASNLD